MQLLQTLRDDKEKSGDFPRRFVKFSSSLAVREVLKKLPCPDNLKLMARITSSLADFPTFFSGVFGERNDVSDNFLCFLRGELTRVSDIPASLSAGFPSFY